MKSVVSRWMDGAGEKFVELLTREGRSGNGFTVSTSPFGETDQGVLDLRGLRLPEGKDLRRVSFESADFGAASFKGGWLERCAFNQCFFDGVSFQRVTDRGNIFATCRFQRSSFRDALIGTMGSTFDRCTFEETDFRRALFVRPEFYGCAFHQNRFDGCDFNGASFEECRFAGTLRGAWFRGGFALASDIEKHGRPRANRMRNVSFEDAILHDVTFSDECDLSSVCPPADCQHALLTNWCERLLRLQELCQSWPAAEADAAKAFASSHMVHARTQQWFILNRADLEAEFGDGSASRIWAACCETITP